MGIDTMGKTVTIVITPRDRYSLLAQCIEVLYANTHHSSFELIVPNLGYPNKDWKLAMQRLESQKNFRIFDYGRIIPMEAMRKIRSELQTDYVVFLDNDSRVTPGWLPPLVEAAERKNAAAVYPIILERSGVDIGENVRNHLFTTELRSVMVDDQKYLIEHKSYRRAKVEDLPAEISQSQAFELHCVMFNVQIFKSIELPQMTIREHLDIGMQLRTRNWKIFVVPHSTVIFDNLGTRAHLSDLKYFKARWNKEITRSSSNLFEKRWGYRFYSEPAIYEWARRRQRFLIMRWLFMPVFLANFVDRVIAAIRRRLYPIWDPLADPNADSELLYESDKGPAPVQLSHDYL